MAAMAKNETKRGRGRPATGQMPKRYFRMDDEGWAAVEAAAKASDVDTSSFIREALTKAAKRVSAKK